MIRTNFKDSLNNHIIDEDNMTVLKWLYTQISHRFEDACVIVSPTTDELCFNVDINLNVDDWTTKSDDLNTMVNYLQYGIFKAYNDVRFRLRRFNPAELSAVVDVKFVGDKSNWIVQVFQIANGKYKIIGCQKGDLNDESAS